MPKAIPPLKQPVEDLLDRAEAGRNDALVEGDIVSPMGLSMNLQKQF